MTDLLQPGQHPDAEQLSAFAENALPPHEREQTLAHLSTCAHCREIVSFALPPFEALQPAPAPEPVPYKSWFSGWNLTWAGGFALAATILVAIVHHRTIVPPASDQTAEIRPLLPPASISAPLPQAAPSSQTFEGNRARTTSAPAAKAAPRPAPQPPAASGPTTLNTLSVQNLPINNRSVQPQLATAPAPYNLDGIADSDAASKPSTFPAGSAASTGTSNGSLAERKAAASSVHGSLQSAPPPAAQASLGAAPAPFSIMAAAPARAPALPTTITLPSHLDVASVLRRGQRILALDTAGTLFLSTDSGAKWKPVTGPWTAHPVHLQLVGTPTPAMAAPAPPPPTNTANFVFAPNSTGITGTVTDATGASIPGATVTVGYRSENFVTRADLRGQFTLSNLPAEATSLNVSSFGFANFHQNISLSKGEILNQNVVLQVGSMAETVDVSSAVAANVDIPSDSPTNNFALRKSRSRTADTFQLTTTNGETWSSPDGEHWQRR